MVHIFVLNLINSYIMDMNLKSEGNNLTRAKQNFLGNFYEKISPFPVIITDVYFLKDNQSFLFKYYINDVTYKKICIRQIKVRTKLSFKKGYRKYITTIDPSL